MNRPQTDAVEKAIGQAEALLEQMALMGYDPSDFGLDEFMPWLQVLTGREIQVVTRDLPFGLTGFWVIDGEFNYICCDAGHPPFFTEHVITHESLHIFQSHIFPEHKTLDIGEQVIAEFLMRLAANRDIVPQIQSRPSITPGDDEIEWATIMIQASSRLRQSPASSNKRVEEYIKITRLD